MSVFNKESIFYEGRVRDFLSDPHEEGKHVMSEELIIYKNPNRCELPACKIWYNEKLDDWYIYENMSGNHHEIRRRFFSDTPRDDWYKLSYFVGRDGGELDVYGNKSLDAKSLTIAQSKAKEKEILDKFSAKYSVADLSDVLRRMEKELPLHLRVAKIKSTRAASDNATADSGDCADCEDKAKDKLIKKLTEENGLLKTEIAATRAKIDRLLAGK